MLDSETKRRIDSARDILVGKVPDPKSQVEQITIALIYKFMDDMDAEAEELGGKRSFFVGEYEKFSWAKLLSPALSGYDMLNLYGESIDKMTRNQGVPQLFRDVFKNAYLPYRDPETLKMFLKTINDFNYDHSEKLGDAFEYLLSVLGSQGDAGQFRTPRHIIDFMVKVLDPQKDESILDPACGTAGFLISAYKHVMASNAKDGKPGGALAPDERAKLADNIRGYDISPDMVRLSLVNLYLHGFTTPNIFEYDTLASEERWNDTADVILANPPFMSPKGGIMPHKKFSVQSNRSEVLFVDYMVEHLTPNGRAAIIVPEGIIFQSAGAYKQLRKYLIENNFLWAVVSLPAGAFNPYSGVKTSILLLDKSLAKKTDKVLFVKVENDGFDLGAQRRKIDKDDLPETLKVLKEYQQFINQKTKTLRVSFPSDSLTVEETLRVSDNPRVSPVDEKPASFAPEIDSALLVSISTLAESDYNLSADRYREVIRVGKQTHPMVAIGDVCTFEYGKPLKSENRIEGEYPVFGSNGIVGYHNEYLIEAPFLVVGRKGSAGEVHYSDKNGFPIDTTFYVKLENEDKVILKYLFHVLKSLDLKSVNTQAGVPGLNRNDAYKIQIPLPPLEIQRQLVDEIATHQRIIDGARQIVEDWKPNVEIELYETLPKGMDEWRYVKLEEVCDSFKNGANFASEQVGKGVKFVNLKDVFAGRYVDTEPLGRIDLTEKEIEKVKLKDGDIVFVRSSVKYEGVGYPALIKTNGETIVFCGFIIKCSPKPDLILPEYLLDVLQTKKMRAKVVNLSNKANITNISQDSLKTLEIPLPPLEIQREIVARIETERAIVHGNRELIRLYEEKVKKVIERVWES